MIDIICSASEAELEYNNIRPFPSQPTFKTKQSKTKQNNTQTNKPQRKHFSCQLYEVMDSVSS